MRAHTSGVLDTSALIDLHMLAPTSLPLTSLITAVTVAELQQGVAMARDPLVRAARAELLGVAMGEFDPLPFTTATAARYGSLVALVLAAGRDPRPRRLDLMIAATASDARVPLYTRNPRDFAGLEPMVTVVPV